MLALVKSGRIVPFNSFNTSNLPAINLGNIGNGEVPIPATPAEIWNEMRTLCLSKATPEVCTGLLGTQPEYFAPEERPKLPSWAWTLIGAIAGISILKLLVK